MLLLRQFDALNISVNRGLRLGLRPPRSDTVKKQYTLQIRSQASPPNRILLPIKVGLVRWVRGVHGLGSSGLGAPGPQGLEHLWGLLSPRTCVFHAERGRPAGSRGLEVSGAQRGKADDSEGPGKGCGGPGRK